MINEDQFNFYQSKKLIPQWIRSRNDYLIGFGYCVAVAIKGKGDPNPTATITVQPQSQVVALHDTAVFDVAASPAG